MLLDDTLAMVNEPDRYEWAWELFKKSRANNWMPTEISMMKDIEQWRSKEVLSDDERLVLKRCLGFFAGTESLVGNNLFLNIYRHVTSGEYRQYMASQLAEEALHNLTIRYVCESLQLDRNEVFQAYKNIPSIKAKDDFLMRVTTDLARMDLDKSSVEGKQEILKNIIAFYIICEGILFYSGFAIILSFGRQGKMPGIVEQINYTQKDETLHLLAGTTLINTIIDEYPEIWNDKFKQEVYSIIGEAVELESAYAKDVLPRGILGLNSELLMDYVHFIGNRRLQSIGLIPMWKESGNPFPWLSEQNDIKKQKNFFESRVIEYQKGNLKDDF